ncbi:unnamed protein product, partial [marine sediment metagenome]
MSVEYLNVTDAALYADVERITLYRWIQKGRYLSWSALLSDGCEYCRVSITSRNMTLT